VKSRGAPIEQPAVEPLFESLPHGQILPLDVRLDLTCVGRRRWRRVIEEHVKYVHAGVSTADGTIVSQDTMPTQSHEGPLAVLDRIATLVARLSKQLGTGVGGGVVIDGQLRLGPLGAAGELGHQTSLPYGPRCDCGNRGCLETLASGPAIAAEGIRLMRMGLAPTLHEIVEGNADRVTTREMMMAAENDDSIHEAITSAAAYIGIAAANVVTTLHPYMIVLGGGVAEIGELPTTTVKKTIAERVGMLPTDNIRVVQSTLGDKAGVIGAIALAADHLGAR